MEKTLLQQVLETEPMDINLLRQQASQLSQKERDKIRAKADELTDGMFSELFPVKRRGPREKRWMPEHLPIGTVVEAVLPFGGMGERAPEQFTVMLTRRNGPRSFVLETDAWDADLEMPKGFNTSYITRVIKRGEDGPSFRPWTRTESPTYADGTPRKSNHEMFMEERYNWIDVLREQGYTPNVKNSYVHYSPREVFERLMAECNLPLANTESLDYDRTVSELYKQTFVITYPMADNYHGMSAVVINKKRAKAWFKRNFRKLLINTVLKAKQDEEESYRDMMKDFDEEFGLRYPEPLEKDKQTSEFDDRDYDQLRGLIFEEDFHAEEEASQSKDDDGGAGDERFALAP